MHRILLSFQIEGQIWSLFTGHECDLRETGHANPNMSLTGSRSSIVEGMFSLNLRCDGIETEKERKEQVIVC